MPEPVILGDFLGWQPPPLETIIGQGIMYKGSKAIIYGRYKSLKSMLALRLGISIASGTDWLGFETTPHGIPVIYLQLEIPQALLHRRVLKMLNSSTGNVGSQRKSDESSTVASRIATTSKSDTTAINTATVPESGSSSDGDTPRTIPPLWIWTEHYIKLDTPEGIKELRRVLDKTQAEVLILDPIYRTISGNMLELHHVQNFIDHIEGLIADYELAIMMVNHTKKGEYENQYANVDDMLGSVLFGAWPDTVIRIERKGRHEETNEQMLLASFEVVRHAEEEIGSRLVRVKSDDISFRALPTNLMEELFND